MNTTTGNNLKYMKYLIIQFLLNVKTHQRSKLLIYKPILKQIVCYPGLTFNVKYRSASSQNEVNNKLNTNKYI